MIIGIQVFQHGDRSLATAWDAEYTLGRYRDEPPVAFIHDIMAAARAADLARALYIGCGNGRNYLPLVADGLDLTGLDISPVAIAQLAARHPHRRDRLELPRVFRTGNLRLVHAAACPFRNSSMTSCGVRYPSPEWRRVLL